MDRIQFYVEPCTLNPKPVCLVIPASIEKPSTLSCCCFCCRCYCCCCYYYYYCCYCYFYSCYFYYFSAAATAAATATDTAPATAAAATGTGYRLSGQDLDWRFQILTKIWGRSSHNWQGLGFSVLSFLFGVWGVEFWVWCLSRASGAKGRLGAGAPKP